MAASALHIILCILCCKLLASAHTNTNQKEQPSESHPAQEKPLPTHRTDPPQRKGEDENTNFHAHLRRLTNFIKWQFNQSILTGGGHWGGLHPVLATLTVMLTYTITQLKLILLRIGEVGVGEKKNTSALEGKTKAREVFLKFPLSCF